MALWPAPLISLYLGESTPEAMLNTSEDADPNSNRKAQICETDFYTAELLLQQGKKDEAAHLFQLAATLAKLLPPSEQLATDVE